VSEIGDRRNTFEFRFAKSKQMTKKEKRRLGAAEASFPG
jgi:hypothetical protein